MKDIEIEMYWIVFEYIFNILEMNLKVWERERDKERVMLVVYICWWLFLIMVLRVLVIV